MGDTDRRECHLSLAKRNQIGLTNTLGSQFNTLDYEGEVFVFEVCSISTMVIAIYILFAQ